MIVVNLFAVKKLNACWLGGMCHCVQLLMTITIKPRVQNLDEAVCISHFLPYEKINLITPNLTIPFLFEFSLETLDMRK